MARILIVDDEEVVRSLIRTVLSHDGHEVQEASDGAEAVEMFRKEPADLVMVDLVMPRKHGLDTILEIRELEPRARIIAMTGALPSLLESDNMAALMGNVRTLAKPMTPADLLQIAREALAEEPAEA
ncbi:MAG: response regulator [Planctomycetota bacterium]|jgi:CheY-like chemotaxis protein